MKLFIFIENDGVTFRPLLFQFGVLDLHFLATIWIIFLYNAAVSGMFLVIPNRMQYLYSLFSKQKQRDTWQFFVFLLFEVYSKGSICGSWAICSGLNIFCVCLSASFWLKHRFNKDTKFQYEIQ